MTAPVIGLDINVTEIQQLSARLHQLGERIPAVAMTRAAAELGQRIKALLLRPTAGWQHPVSADVKVIFHGGSDVELQITIDDNIYVMLSQGTRPHLIIPHGNYPLAFRAGYRAMTQPNSLYPSGGGSFGDTVYARAANHPGTAARNFPETALREIRPEIPAVIQAEIEKEVGRFLGRGGL